MNPQITQIPPIRKKTVAELGIGVLSLRNLCNLCNLRMIYR